jgi:hypothetical protein
MKKMMIVRGEIGLEREGKGCGYKGMRGGLGGRRGEERVGG